MIEPSSPKNIVCLISGRGSNLEAILRTAREENWADSQADSPNARVAAVVSNRPGVRGLAIAQEYGVPTRVLDHAGYPSREAFDADLRTAIDAFDPALVILAGFMRVLTPAFVAHYAGRLINIHPSLLPAFPGLATHRRALEAGVRVHGTTVHFVTGELDAGPIIGQAALAVDPADTEESLAARVLAMEHQLLPRCVRWLLAGAARLEQGRVAVRGLSRQELLQCEP